MFEQKTMRVDYPEKMQSYIDALEAERRKILVFERELPLCLELVTQAIGACKQQLSGKGAAAECNNNNNGNGQSECSEQTSTEGTPVLEEFIPMKRPSRSDDHDGDEEEEEEEHQHSSKLKKIDGHRDAGNNEKSSSADSKRKSDWLRSAQLWNQSPDPLPKQEHQSPRKVSVVEVKRNGGAFHPFQRDQKGSEKSHQSSEKLHLSMPTATTSSTSETATGGRKESEKEAPTPTLTQTQIQTQSHAQRKQRRCWSPELHRRFLQALQQLGGSHAATPKQIRELMKVDGLTNDEVKSHLQKFRLHTRRPSPAVPNNSSSQPPQIVVVGGIWVPPPDYAAVEKAKTAATNGVYAPVASVPPLPVATPEANSAQNRQQQEGRGSDSCRSNSSPSSTSSSSHTTTAYRLC